jgi:hypothetical protein
MTAPMMTLADLAEKGPDVDVLRQMVQFMAQRLMEIDVEGRCGAGYDEKAPGTRLNSRNGFRDRVWETRAGAVELQIQAAGPRHGCQALQGHRLAAGVPEDAVIMRRARARRRPCLRGDRRARNPCTSHNWGLLIMAGTVISFHSQIVDVRHDLHRRQGSLLRADAISPETVGSPACCTRGPVAQRFLGRKLPRAASCQEQRRKAVTHPWPNSRSRCCSRAKVAESGQPEVPRASTAEVPRA